ncbi:MAG: SdpI family protein [Chloroflexota bacterium]
MTFPFRSASIAAITVATGASILAYPFLPRRVATRFNQDGRATAYGSRKSAAIVFPMMMAALLIFNDLLGRWPGGRDRENVASGERAREEAVGLVEMASLPTHLAILGIGIGLPISLRRLLPAVYGVLMVALGNVLPKLPRNSLVGIRTPWTMLDPEVWERTHRLGGYLVTGSGVVSLASLVLAGKRAERISGLAIGGSAVISTAYSFVVYRKRSRP